MAVISIGVTDQFTKSTSTMTGNDNMAKVLKRDGKRLCYECMSEAKYSGTRFDTIYCESCDEWLEPTCSYIGCKHCRNRPEKPSNAVMEVME